MDLTSAVNVMMWAGIDTQGQPGYAEWVIFAPEDATPLRQFIRETLHFSGPGDPIHSQTVCLTPTRLWLLQERHGIRPYIIKQYQHDAVYIPAGCPHQVCDYVDHLLYLH